MPLPSYPSHILTPEEIEVIRKIRGRNFAVCIFVPSEMPHSDPEHIEEVMCQAGWSKIMDDAVQSYEKEVGDATPIILDSPNP